MVGRAVPPGNLRGTHWVQALWTIYLGMAGPLLGLVVGQHTAIAAAAMWAAVGRGPHHCRGQQPSKGVEDDAGDASAPTTGPVTAAPGPLRAAQAPNQGAAGAGLPGALGRGAADGDGPSETAADAAGGHAARCGADAPPGVSGSPIPSVVLEMADGELRPVSASTAAATAGSPSASHAAALQQSLSPAVVPPDEGLPSLLVDLAAGAVLATLTGVSLAYAYLDRPPSPAATDRWFWWLAILLGPLGCFARWHLSRLNGLRGGWLQAGTFAANLAGCGLVFVCEALLFRLAGSLEQAQRVALQGLMVGSAGCLTTVSTYVVEIQKLALTSPGGAYKYFLASTVVPVALGLLVYGIPVWLGTR